MTTTKSTKGRFLLELAAETRRAALYVGLPVVVVGTVPLLGAVIWHLAATEVDLTRSWGWAWGLLLAGGILASVVVRYAVERREAWVSDTFWALGSATFLAAERSGLAVALLGFAIGSLMSDYASHTRRQKSGDVRSRS